MTDKERFFSLRKRLFKAIDKALQEDSHCKSYEGSIAITQQFPDFFEDEYAKESSDYYRITLHCYVLGPARHYDFIGSTFSAALDKFEKWITTYAEVQE